MLTPIRSHYWLDEPLGKKGCRHLKRNMKRRARRAERRKPVNDGQ